MAAGGNVSTTRRGLASAPNALIWCQRGTKATERSVFQLSTDGVHPLICAGMRILRTLILKWDQSTLTTKLTIVSAAGGALIALLLRFLDDETDMIFEHVVVTGAVVVALLLGIRAGGK